MIGGYKFTRLADGSLSFQKWHFAGMRAVAYGKCFPAGVLVKNSEWHYNEADLCRLFQGRQCPARGHLVRMLDKFLWLAWENCKACLNSESLRITLGNAEQFFGPEESTARISKFSRT